MKTKKIFLFIVLFVICFKVVFNFNHTTSLVKESNKVNRNISRDDIINSCDDFYNTIKKHMYRMDKKFTIKTSLKLTNELKNNNWKKWNKIADKLHKEQIIMNMDYRILECSYITCYNYVEHEINIKYGVGNKDLKKYYKFIKRWNRKHMTSAMTEEEKVRKIHNYIVSKYNYSYGDKGKDWFNRNSKNAANAKLGKYSVYSPLALVFKKGGVCEAYTKLFYSMAKKAGLDVKYVSGTIKNEGRHAWNLVKVEGKWYHIDVTWDDYNIGSEDYDYQYYLKSDKYMRKHMHSWDKKAYPKCKTSYKIIER